MSPAQLFFRLMDLWHVEDEHGQVLLQVAPAEYSALHIRASSGIQAGSTLTAQQVKRVTYLASIFRALQILLPSRERALGWVKEPNARFEGLTALEFMCEDGSIDRLAEVCAYLEGELM